jgi:hypothetical protein
MTNEEFNPNCLLIGIMIGALLMLGFTMLFPRHVRAVNEQLVKEGLASYSPTTGEIIWKECENNDK